MFTADCLDLGENQLSGTISTEIGKLTNLTELYLNGNELSGAIPAEIGQITILNSLDLSDNELSGAIPAEIGQITGRGLSNMDLSDNQLSGTIPAEIGKLKNLYRLDLGENRLSGTIPSEIGQLTRLTHLYLNDNKLRLNVLPGNIPVELSPLLPNLQALDLTGNLFETEAEITPPADGGPGEDGDPPGPSGSIGRFSDDDDSVHQANIEVIADRGITMGCDPTHLDRFCPDREITRAQMMAFLARALGEEGDPEAESSFADVADDAWYLPYLARLAELGVAEADPDGAFRPLDPLTRADMAVLLTRAFDHIAAAAEPAGVFEDVPADAPHASEVEAILNAGITRGCSNQPMLYCPDDTVTRAQMASFLARALENTP